MKKLLKRRVIQLQTKILMIYGNTAYQISSKDWYLEKVPNNLKEIWHTQIPFSVHYKHNINSMSNYELLCLYISECRLIARLKRIFSNLENRK